MVELNGTLLFSILNFLILVAVLGHFCYKPLLKVMEDRKNRIKGDLDHAATAKADAAKLKGELEAQLADARVTAQGIVDQAVKEAKVQAQAQIDEAREVIEKEKEMAARQIQRERKDALEDLRDQVAVLSCDIASKIINENMTPDMNERLIAESIARLDAKKAGN
ncbi:MAG: F0F1 ATP synthase subunit B [Dialister sp.]|nr:F0F1 ATP synthase subunit B [Dialister sp.]